jgi:hypothetical protein
MTLAWSLRNTVGGAAYERASGGGATKLQLAVRAHRQKSVVRNLYTNFGQILMTAFRRQREGGAEQQVYREFSGQSHAAVTSQLRNSVRTPNRTIVGIEYSVV